MEIRLGAAARSHRISLLFIDGEQAQDANHFERLGYERSGVDQLCAASQFCRKPKRIHDRTDAG
jgi:hypothetical protein